MSDQAEKAKAIFLDAIERYDPEQWAAYLDEVCAGDPALRDRVERLLHARAQLGSFHEEPRPPAVAAVDQPMAKGPGTVIGPYKLLEQIGEGGFGVVFMAEQTHPVRRKVALKVLKPGMDTRPVVARFEAERQALALMDHPNIARVFDGGATPSGRPYFVMELVRGVPITEFCDQNQLTPRQRLELFVTVCRAVQHAHQKGIIHRDLKPSNVLVSRHDATPVVKVIDFGVAKALGQELTDKTLFTGIAQMVGTPLYMSPEQAGMSDLDVDTRSDVYSLGVLLYELLTGTTPFPKERFKQAAYDEIRRIIREEEPPRPSTRLSESKDALPSIAAQRHTEPARLTRLVRGELDWVVMKALEKDRARRYETANGFAADLQRYLADEPVLACPPSAGYRVRKFVRRHKGPVIAVTLVLLALVAGVIATTWGMLRASEARADAEDEAKHKQTALSAALLEKQRADEQAAIAKGVTGYLEQMLGSFTTASGKGPDYTVLQLFNDYAADLEKQPPVHPEVEAALRATIGKGYGVLGQRDKAKKHLARALELRRSVFGDEHEKYADSLVAYASPHAHSDPNALPACEADVRRALAIYRARGVGGQPVIRALWTLRWILVVQAHAGSPAKWAELEPVVKEALAEARKFPGAEFPEMAGIYQGWADSKIAQGRYAEAETIARQAVAMTRSLRPDHPEVVWGHFVLAAALRKQNKFTEAMQADKQVLTIIHKVAPPGHTVLALALTGVMDTLDAADKSHALTELFPSTAELGELESVFRQVLTATKPSKLNYEDPALVAARGLVRFSEFYRHLGHEFAAAGKAKEAEESRRKANLALESLQSEVAGKPDLLPYVYSDGAVALMKRGQAERAKELRRKLLDQGTPKSGGAHNNLAWYLATAEAPAHRDPDLAVELAKKAVESDPQSSSCRNTLGVARYRAGDWKQAISDLEQSVSLGKGGTGYDWFFLAMAHWQLGEKDEARKWYSRAVQWMDKYQPANEELRRFRAEAEELLGRNGKK
jgi:serine/threonine protein kinase/Tfp pilus assembly protein PilF